MINDILSKEDILCMQYAGMKSSRIMSHKTRFFMTFYDM